MKVTKIDSFPISVPYTHTEVSSTVERNGVTDIIVKLSADNGLIGWGECCTAANAAGIDHAVRSAAPFILGRDPWDKEAIAWDFLNPGHWQFQPMTGNFAFAGIDMALWDLCGQECGQPLYKLFGGARRDEVDYFYYLSRANEAELETQCRNGIEQGYTVFYLKVGLDAPAEEAMIDAVRRTIGPDRKIRIDANQSWSVPQATCLLNDWHEKFNIDFAEAPVRIDPVDNMLDVKRRVSTSLCANEGLWREVDALRVIQSRCAEYLCFSPYWVGSLRRFLTIAHMADLAGLLVCKHTHGELGLAAAAGQHMMLCVPNAVTGNQQTAQMMADDILTAMIPISESPKWRRIEAPGLGVAVDEEKVMTYHEVYLRDGEFVPFGGGFSQHA